MAAVRGRRQVRVWDRPSEGRGFLAGGLVVGVARSSWGARFSCRVGLTNLASLGCDAVGADFSGVGPYYSVREHLPASTCTSSTPGATGR
jgi:hypothetical protein